MTHDEPQRNATMIASDSIDTRETVTLKTGWRFAGGKNLQANQPGFDDSGWETVSLPHDWGIRGPFIPDGDGSTGKLPWKAEGWYRNWLNIAEQDAGKTVYLVFDGVMAMPEVYVNGAFAGGWDFGYNSFWLDITAFVKPGAENLVAVHADTRRHGARWYPGGGIYRKVWMVVANPVHVGIWGTSISTPIVKPNCTDVRIRTTVLNRSGEDKSALVVESIIYSPQGNEVAHQAKEITVKGGGSHETEQTLTLHNPQRWDLDSPALYKLKTIIKSGTTVTDTYVSTFGVRTMRFTANNGFYLNDKRVQLKGVNLHHDHGPLGAAFYRRAMQRQIEIMKSMGCNAIRTSHNVPSPELLELCDEMGMLVFDEIFDKWNAHCDMTEETDFHEFMDRNVRNWIQRDRNHPCVFIYSVGNEMTSIQRNENNGFRDLNTVISLVRGYDPTRPVTMVNCWPETAVLRHFDYYDVHCWNYGRKYAPARQLEPEKSVIISESASTVSTRGHYAFPLPKEKTDFGDSLHVSSYDLNAMVWAEVADDDFMWQQDEPYIAGEFVWTGFDYLGEPSPYSNSKVKEMGLTDREASRSSYFGIVDLCGISKDRYYLYKSYWRPDETTIHIVPHWNWEDRLGEVTPVFVYTNGDGAELFLNGKSLGRKSKNPKSANSIERFRLMWNDVVYESGELKAVAWKEGEIIGEQTVRTAGPPHQIRLTPDRTVIATGGDDLSYILIEALDREGNPCPLADNEIELTLSGPGTIAGVGNGNPQSLAPMQDNRVTLFYGKAMLILKSGLESGHVDIKAEAAGLLRGGAQVEIRKEGGVKELLRSSPHPDVELDIPRDTTTGREVDL